MNRALVWGFAATVALSVWALLNPRTPDNAPASSKVIAAAARVDVPKDAAQASTSPIAHPLPDAWPAPAMEPAARSPFASPQPPVPKSVTKAPVVAAPPPPPPPPADYRFWGRMISPDRQSLLFLARGQDGTPVEIRTGTRLEGGWSVESISDNAIVIANAATRQHTTILVPPADAAAMR